MRLPKLRVSVGPMVIEVSPLSMFKEVQTGTNLPAQIDIYATDAKIKRYGLNVLADDLAYFPRYDAVLLHRFEHFGAAEGVIWTLPEDQVREFVARLLPTAEQTEVERLREARVLLRGGIASLKRGGVGLDVPALRRGGRRLQPQASHHQIGRAHV